MAALGALPNVDSIRIGRGKLSFYQEFPDAAADATDKALLPRLP